MLLPLYNKYLIPESGSVLPLSQRLCIIDITITCVRMRVSDLSEFVWLIKTTVYRITTQPSSFLRGQTESTGMEGAYMPTTEKASKRLVYQPNI